VQNFVFSWSISTPKNHLMKKHYLFIFMFVLAAASVFGQDEGTVKAKQRFERDNTIFFSVGPSFVIGKNLGDYSTGLAFEAGYLKRRNKILSLGASLSYLSYNYDRAKTYPNYYDEDNDFTLEITNTGGDISLLSLGANIKVNLIPVGDNTKFTVYGIVHPFVSMVSRSAISETAILYVDENQDGVYNESSGQVTYDGSDYDALKSNSKFTGGAYLGFGVELFPSNQFSFFAQATFSYTLPVSYLSTKSYLHDEDRYQDANGKIYYDAYTTVYQNEFPIIKKGFTGASLRVGLAYNF